MRLLLIEDNASLRRYLAKGLREVGYAVDCTGDGEEGAWCAQDTAYDLILLDRMLPGKDGLTILRELRARHQDVHVLILTAKDTVEDRVAGLNAGADDYLVKPFAFEELLARIQALVRRRYGCKQPEVRIGELRLDLAARRLWRGTTEVPLTRREYALLEYLALHAGQVVSRAEIWDHVYEFNSTTSSNVVDVYIGYLRRKLDTPGQASLIETVRGRGYCLREDRP